jgi:hypothetical protein
MNMLKTSFPAGVGHFTQMRLYLMYRLWLAVLLAAGVQTASAYYDPAPQRWINRDPIAEAGGLNLHTHSQNDSINRFDPFGDTVASRATAQVPTHVTQPYPILFPEHPASVDMNRCQVPNTAGNAPVARPPFSNYERCSVRGLRRNIGDPYTATLECPCTGTLTQSCIDYQECSEDTVGTLSGTILALVWTPKTTCSPSECPEYKCK